MIGTHLYLETFHPYFIEFMAMQIEYEKKLMHDYEDILPISRLNIVIENNLQVIFYIL